VHRIPSRAGLHQPPAKAVETPQVLNENIPEATGTAGRLYERYCFAYQLEQGLTGAFRQIA